MKDCYATHPEVFRNPRFMFPLCGLKVGRWPHVWILVDLYMVTWWVGHSKMRLSYRSRSPVGIIPTRAIG
jgi:hypothetical protein